MQMIVVTAAFAVGSFLAAAGLPLSFAASCTQAEVIAGLCSITPSTTDTSVVLDGVVPGGGASDPTDGTGDSTDTSTGSDSDSAAEESTCVIVNAPTPRCFSGPRGPRASASPTPAPTETVTIGDVATFTPVLSAPASEPSGWAFAGLPVNLVGPSGSVSVSGALLGRPAEVLFTPVAWRWEHGDGTVARPGTAGASWAALGLADFSPTSTSHVYASRGTYRVQLVVTLAARYRFDGGAWRPVPGTIDVATPPFELVVASASTVLVERDCLAAPTGPGC